MARRFMSPAEYGLMAANLEALTSQVAEAKNPKEKAEREMLLGDAWAAARGKLLRYSLDTMSTKESVFHEEPDVAEFNRQTNGATLGFRNADAEMEARDELRHATRWWLEAARTLPASPLSAAARLKVLEAMSQIAVASDYSFSRAGETGMPAVSREIYDRLQAESPGSGEAGKAAYLSLSGTQSVGGSDSDGFRSREAGYLWSDFGAFGDFQEEGYSNEGAGIGDLRGSSLDVAGLTQEVESLSKTAQGAKTSPSVTNCLEDLTSFLREPGLTAEAAHAYINLRIDVLACSFGLPFELHVEGVPPDKDADDEVRDRITKVLQDPKMKNVRDYLEFLDAAVVANHRISIETAEQDKGEAFTYNSRDYPALENMMRTFLKRYPHSRPLPMSRRICALEPQKSSQEVAH